MTRCDAAARQPLREVQAYFKSMAVSYVHMLQRNRAFHKAFVANLDLKIVFLRSQTVTVSFYLQRRGKRVVSNLENNEGESRTASEMADVLYHSMALLAKKGVKIEDVLQVLRLRFSQSGIEEKKSRVFQKSMD
ncbi:Histidine biosynthesis bifunctional protein hisIE, chloroplastic isoform B [Glycine soja]|uniref:phosphoribosyl-ATP diphosphatase n=1 Tax=Glycine soja TaxID=3848 RepID=A0A445HHK9_GLYSO|nr:Histidine biosynthesis bifunctional protein hisIE, chloroplastic isoform A [Glycine soja]RZB73196.1 Histidine biosynthesis bifunctional protein hisIE, chloroplastic isoform B [Glycine soja]